MSTQQIRALYQSAIEQLQLTYNLGYKQFHLSDKNTILNHLQNQNSLPNHLLDPSALFMSTSIYAFLAAFHFFRHTKIGVMSPCDPHQLKLLHSIDDDLIEIDDLEKVELGQIGVLVMHSHNLLEKRVGIQRVLEKCKQENTIVYFIQNEYVQNLVESSRILSLYPKYDNFIWIQHIGIQFLDKINWSFALTLIPNQQLKSLYPQYGSNAFKMISSNIGLILSKAFFTQTAINSRKLLSAKFVKNFLFVSKVLSKLQIRFVLIELKVFVLDSQFTGKDYSTINLLSDPSEVNKFLLKFDKKQRAKL